MQIREIAASDLEAVYRLLAADGWAHRIPDENVTWVLRAGREGAPAFFARLGFVQSTLAMERSRTAQG